MAAFKSLLVSSDLTEASARVLNYAVDFAGKLGARITLLHVYSLPVYNFPDGSFIPTSDVATRIGEAARRHLEATAERLRAKGVAVEAILASGTPAEEIIRVAKETKADLIVVGTHGRGAIGRALLGSTANVVVRTAPVPVLTLRYEHG